MSDSFYRGGLIAGWAGFWIYLLFASSFGFLLWLVGTIMVLCVIIPGVIRLLVDTWRLWS